MFRQQLKTVSLMPVNFHHWLKYKKYDIGLLQSKHLCSLWVTASDSVWCDWQICTLFCVLYYFVPFRGYNITFLAVYTRCLLRITCIETIMWVPHRQLSNPIWARASRHHFKQYVFTSFTVLTLFDFFYISEDSLINYSAQHNCFAVKCICQHRLPWLYECFIKPEIRWIQA